MARTAPYPLAWTAAALLSAACGGRFERGSPLVLGPIVDAVSPGEPAPLAFSRREVTCLLRNDSDQAVEIRRLRPTVSTTVSSDRGLPPFVVPPGGSVLLSIRASNHDPEPRTRRVEIEFEGGAAMILVPVDAAPRKSG